MFDNDTMLHKDCLARTRNCTMQPRSVGSAADSANSRVMSESRNAFCKFIKERYPVLAAKADTEFERLWGDFVDDEYYSYSWFEALANALNQEMKRGVGASECEELLSVISANFESGDDDVRQCIDVAFVENLFWQVSPDRSAAYWMALPENLKCLYIDFHSRSPL